MHMKEIYFHEIAVYRVPISIKKIKTFLKSSCCYLKSSWSFLKTSLYWGDLYDSHSHTYAQTRTYICVASCRHTCVRDFIWSHLLKKLFYSISLRRYNNKEAESNLSWISAFLFINTTLGNRTTVSIRPRACFFPLFSFLPLWLHYNLNPLCVQY